MGRPSRFGEKTRAIRVPESKLPTIQQILEGGDPGFVRNDDAIVDRLVQDAIDMCESRGLDPRALMLSLLMQSVCEKLDRCHPPEQQQFIAQLIERYLGAK